MSVQALSGLAEANARSMAACWALGLLCHGHPAELVHEIAVHRRELAVDIVRALLAGGASIGLAHRILALTARVRARSASAAWAEMGMAERDLHREFRRVLAQSCGGDAISGMLGLHYLRVELHHRELHDLHLDPCAPPRAKIARQGCNA